MKSADYIQLDGSSLSALVRDGEMEILEILESAIDRLEEVNPQLNPVVADLREAATAAVADGIPRGPAVSVPVLIKDVETDIAGTVTTNCSRLFLDNVPPSDSEIVRRLRDAGALILGKSNAPEFAYSSTTEPVIFGPTRNPWNPTRSVGGSSGGAACAVATGIVPMAHATDGGGSTRLPAAFCGVIGLKPSRGRITTAPSSSSARGGLIVDGCITRSVRDCAVFLDAVSGLAVGDPYTAPAPAQSYISAVTSEPPPKRVALIVEFDGIPVDSAWRDAAIATAKASEEIGHLVEVATFPVRLEELLEIAGTLVPAYIAALVERRLATLGRPLADEDLEPLTRAGVERGRSLTAIQYVAEYERAIAVGRTMGTFFERYDIVITPTSSHPAPLLGTFDHAHLPTDARSGSSPTSFTRPFNVSGQPAITLPVARADDGMPLGVQLAARYGEEPLLLAFAAQLERMGRWPTLVASGPWS